MGVGYACRCTSSGRTRRRVQCRGSRFLTAGCTVSPRPAQNPPAPPTLSSSFAFASALMRPSLAINTPLITIPPAYPRQNTTHAPRPSLDTIDLSPTSSFHYQHHPALPGKHALTAPLRCKTRHLPRACGSPCALTYREGPASTPRAEYALGTPPRPVLNLLPAAVSLHLQTTQTFANTVYASSSLSSPAPSLVYPRHHPRQKLSLSRRGCPNASFVPLTTKETPWLPKDLPNPPLAPSWRANNTSAPLPSCP